MIGHLTGRILRIQNDRCWVDVGGVAYIVSVGARLATELALSGTISLWIETIVHDGQEHLFGLLTPEEQTWFQWLIAVSGVGGRVAMSLLSSFSPHALAGVVQRGEGAALRQVDGVGPKLANRLMTELKDKAEAWVGQDAGTHEGMKPDQGVFLGIHKDAVLALVASRCALTVSAVMSGALLPQSLRM